MQRLYITVAIVVLAVLSASACSREREDFTKYERALRNHSAMNLLPYGVVTDVHCRAIDPTSQYEWRDQQAYCELHTENNRWPRWYACNDNTEPGNIVCWGQDPDPRSAVFETRAWMEAPKYVTWKCEDADERGRDIGPVMVSLRHDRKAPVQVLDWRTKARAQKVARSNGTTLSVDC